MPIIPVLSVVKLDFYAVFIIIVVVWFPKVEVLKAILCHSFLEKYMIRSGFGLAERKSLIAVRCYIQASYHSRQNLHWDPAVWGRSRMFLTNENFKGAENTRLLIITWTASYELMTRTSCWCKLTYLEVFRSSSLCMLIRSPPMSLQKFRASSQVFLRSSFFL